MPQLSAAGREAIRALAERLGFTIDAVSNMLEALVAGQGRMAQFDHPEFGGAGQWMRGGMTMVSDMFNAPLKGRVGRLCDELSALGGDAFIEVPSAREASPFAPTPWAQDHRPNRPWWPAEFGRPDAAGSQNDTRYAYFATLRRLAIEANARVTVYDTLDHRIGGVAQQQSGHAALLFTSQHGPIDVRTLPA